MAFPRVLKIDPEYPEAELIRKAAAVILTGGVVAYPTDTVYGLGALPSDEEAVKRIHEVKKRAGKPIPLILSDTSQTFKYGVMTKKALMLAENFWPGPLTIIVEAKPGLSDLITLGTGKIGLRVPDHKVAIALSEMCGGAITGTSANISGAVSPRTADEVIAQLDGFIDLVIDSGPARYGLSSTVIDVTTKPPTILRIGPLDPEEIESVLGEEVVVATKS